MLEILIWTHTPLWLLLLSIFGYVKLVLEIQHCALTIEPSISRLTAFIGFFGVSSGIRIIVIVDVLGSTVDARAADEEGVSVLLGWLHHDYLLLVAKRGIVRVSIIHAACAFVYFLLNRTLLHPRLTFSICVRHLVLSRLPHLVRLTARSFLHPVLTVIIESSSSSSVI